MLVTEDSHTLGFLTARATASSLYPAGAEKSTTGLLLLGHCKVTLPRKGRQIHVWTPTTGPLQAHFTPQGPTNPRLDPYYGATASSLYCAGADKSTSGPLLPGHCKVTLPRKGRQIHVWNLTKGPLQAHFAPQGPTNPRLDPCYWATASSLYK